MNAKIFQESKEPLMSTLQHILATHSTLPIKEPKKDMQRKIDETVPLKTLPMAFFDGAEQFNICGCGVHIIMDEKLQYFLS